MEFHFLVIYECPGNEYTVNIFLSDRLTVSNDIPRPASMSPLNVSVPLVLPTCVTCSIYYLVNHFLGLTIHRPLFAVCDFDREDYVEAICFANMLDVGFPK